MPVNVKQISGDLLEQKVEVIVNPWNMNVIPWWLLLPQGVSGAIKKRGGTQPFRELAKTGWFHLGEARITGPGSLPFKAIIHVAGINLLWFATRYSVKTSVENAMRLVNDNGFKSVAFPLIGSGSGNRGKAWSKEIMLETFVSLETSAEVLLVEFPG
ncbi:MAG: macro domain-containing protein [Candidatus Rifleibacteriota bacterium]